MQLRVPAGALVLTLEGEPSPVVFEVRLDVWDHWLSIANEQTRRAELTHARVLDAQREGDEDVRIRALEAEFRASMQAIAATAFAVDALYAAVKERSAADDVIGGATDDRRKARYRQIAETLRRAFRIQRGTDKLEEFLRRLFELRNWAVHAPNDFRRPVEHPDLGLGVEWRFVAYSAMNARTLLDATVSLLEQIFRFAEERSSEIVREWAQSGEERLRLALPVDAAAPEEQVHYTSRETALAAFAGAAPIDPERFRADLDGLVEQDPAPRG